MSFSPDRLVFTPDDVDLSRSPLAGLGVETYVLGAFNPGLTRLPNGNLLLMVRVAEALRKPVFGGHAHRIRWSPAGFVLDAFPLDAVEMNDPRHFDLRDQPSPTTALTSLSWLLPVELTPDGMGIVAIDYHRAIAPARSYQSDGIEDARISLVDGRYLMTTCSVSPERLCTTLYSSPDTRDWTLEGIVLDHQNKDMLIFEGLIDGKYWAQTRPLGPLYFAYPPDSEWRSGPAIQFASSPDALHWKPYDKPGLRPHAATLSTSRMGGGAPPVRTRDGWLSLWHGVEPGADVGRYRTYWSLLDPADPSITIRTEHHALIHPDPALTAPFDDRLYLREVVFTTGLVEHGEQYIVASGECDFACRITHLPRAHFD